ncbi:MAG: DUF262 domain-containing protein [Phycisphaerae bacterium]|nr:DUF262 domain-containing protein [Phycisphaerae bacterium]
MNIDADELTIHSLFNRGDFVFRVPTYQRPYDWGPDQWSDLWDDVTDSELDGVHFIGSLVAIKKGAAVKGFNDLEIVDGQQRLTTLSILFCALRDCYKDKGDNKATGSIQETLLESHTFRDRSRKLFLGRVDDNNYESLCNGKPPEKHNITLAYEFFKEKINCNGNINDIAEKFTSGVSLVLITAENAEDAFKLFETLNDRGLQLSAVDLIKNYILSHTAKQNSEELDAVIEIWDTIINHLEDIDKIRFFRQFILSNYPGKVTKQTLYPVYKNQIEKTKDASNFILDLCEAAEYYEHIYEQTFDDQKLNEKLEDLINLKATTSFTLVMRLLIEKWPINDILKIIPSIETFSLRRAICGWSTNEMEVIYNQIANSDGGIPTPKEISDYLKERTPKDDEFKAKFIQRDFRQDTQTKYVLEQFEYFKVGTREKRISGRQNVHIEHIMPLTIISKRCKKRHGGDWRKYLGENAGKHSEYVHKIGNLTLLAAELNVPASNNPFASKKTFYEKSEIRITNNLCMFDDWQIGEIQKRSNQLAGTALEIWKI